MPKKYRITLRPEERQHLEGLLSRGKVSALKQRHARILLLADENRSGGSDSDATGAFSFTSSNGDEASGGDGGGQHQRTAMYQFGANQPHNIIQPTLFIGNVFIYCGVV